MDYTGTDRQAKMRERRKAEGWKRVEIWVKPEAIPPKEAVNRLKQYLREIENAGPDHSDSTKLAIFKADMWSLLSDMDWE